MRTQTGPVSSLLNRDSQGSGSVPRCGADVSHVIAFEVFICLCFLACEMGTILFNKNSLEVNDNHIVY